MMAVSVRCVIALLALLLVAAMNPVRAEDYQQTLVEDNRTLTLQISNQFTPRQRAEVVVWIEFIAAALRQVYGYWPREEWNISVAAASAAGSDPIPWAQVNRDAVDVVEFYAAPTANATDLKQAWTGYHELAHLLIPYRGWGDAWFSEGLARYYQNVLQARAGMLTEQQTWQHLYDGFARGRDDTAFNDQTLSDVSDAMRDNGGFMRVYWSGAWYFLSLDIRLRRQSGGDITLDSALQKLNQCCADQSMSVPEMVQKLDAMNSVLLFHPLYDQVRVSTQMPAFETVFASLGITVTDGTVHLQQQGPGARLRQQILQPLPL
jgi:hypothetical protein